MVFKKRIDRHINYAFESKNERIYIENVIINPLILGNFSNGTLYKSAVKMK
ncbi:hypothetical protein bcgnr5390_15320 [Bacillus luti]|nr:hypothetical protein BC2903_46250 [Bacillus cereus]